MCNIKKKRKLINFTSTINLQNSLDEKINKQNKKIQYNELLQFKRTKKKDSEQ